RMQPSPALFSCVRFPFSNRDFTVTARSLPPEAGFLLERLQRVVDDRAVAGAIDELPHAAGDRSVAAHHMREAAAGIRALVVNGTRGAVQEHASAFVGAAQNRPLLGILHGVLSLECRLRDAKVARQMLDVA